MSAIQTFIKTIMAATTQLSLTGKTIMVFSIFLCIHVQKGICQNTIDPGRYNVQFQTTEYQQISTCNGFGERSNTCIVKAASSLSELENNVFTCIDWEDQALSPIWYQETQTLFNAGNIDHKTIGIDLQMWNHTENCVLGNDRCTYNDNFSCPDCDRSSLTGLFSYQLGKIGRWFDNTLDLDDDQIKVRSIWRPAGGDTPLDPISFGTLTNNEFLNHNNSNRQAPADAVANMGYTDYWDSSNHPSFNASQDVFYRFTIDADMRVIISTDWSNTDFLSKLVLMKEVGGEYFPLHTKSAGNLTENTTIISALSAGTYNIQVEGVNSFDQGDFTLSVFAKELIPVAGSIGMPIGHDGILCPGSPIPALINQVASGYGTFDYSNSTLISQEPIYTWYMVASGGNPTLLPNQSGSSIDVTNLTLINSEFSSIEFYRYARYGVDLFISNRLSFSRCPIPSYSYCTYPIEFVTNDSKQYLAVVNNTNAYPSTTVLPECINPNNTGVLGAADTWLTFKMPYTGRVRLQIASLDNDDIVSGDEINSTNDWQMVVYKGNCSLGTNLESIACENVYLGDNNDEIAEYIYDEFSGINPGDDVMLRIWDTGSDHYGSLVILGYNALSCSDSEIFNDKLGSGSWNDAARWFNNSIPQVCDDVNIVNGSVNINNPAACKVLLVGQGNSLTIANGQTLEVHGDIVQE